MHEMKPEHDCAAVGNINVLTVLLSTTIITIIYQILHLFVCLYCEKQNSLIALNLLHRICYSYQNWMTFDLNVKLNVNYSIKTETARNACM